MSYSLYQLSEDAQALSQLIEENAIENEGIIDDVLLQWEEELGDDINRKVEGYCQIIRSKEALAKQLEEEEKEFDRRKQAAKNEAKRLKERLQFGLEMAGKNKVESGLWKVSIQNNPPTAEIVDEKEIPDEYKKVSLNLPYIECPSYLLLTEFAQVSVKKKELVEAIKEGKSIDGAYLVQGKSIRIRIAS